MITHIVLFKLKDSSPEKVEEARQMLAGLWGKVPQLRSLEVGIDVLRSQRSYDLSLVANFETLADLEAYQVHPEHKVVVDYMNRVRESAAVVDYHSR